MGWLGSAGWFVLLQVGYCWTNSACLYSAAGQNGRDGPRGLHWLLRHLRLLHLVDLGFSHWGGLAVVGCLAWRLASKRKALNIPEGRSCCNKATNKASLCSSGRVTPGLIASASWRVKWQTYREGEGIVGSHPWRLSASCLLWISFNL